MRVATIVNPASGQEHPLLALLDRIFGEHQVDWDVFVTRRDGDAERYVAEALAEEYDLVAAYGGDGTISAVASALVGRETALAILPGGTGNVIAQELEVPLELEEALRLACRGPAASVAIDAVSFRERYSLLRIGAGADARMIGAATREQKDRLGWLAYVIGALAQLREPELTLYRLSLDGRELELEGLTCIVANVGRIGRGGLSFSRSIDPFDGVLDVLFVRGADLGDIAAIGAQLLGLGESVPADDDAPVLHFQAREVSVQSDPPVPVHCDGDEAGETPFTARVHPGAVRIVLPDAGQE